MMLLFLLLVVSLCSSPLLAAPIKRSTNVPAIPFDFPDPSIINVNGPWYAFATSIRGINVQVARSEDFNTWNLLGKDAMPQLPAWVAPSNPEVWAPEVIQRDDGQFVLYFSAALASSTSKHCIGVAISTNVDGPYTAVGKPLICPDPDGNGRVVDSIISSPGIGGAIDAGAFKDVDGSRYIVYKVDGNSLGPGGPCGNGGSEQKPTPLMLVPVAADGITPRGPAIDLLDRIAMDGPVIEAPSITRTADGKYQLFFSSNCYNTQWYDVTWATAPSITGPYTRFGPLFVSGQNGLMAPGGAAVASDGQHMVFHGNFNGGRAMYTTTIGVSGGTLRSLS